MRGECGCLTCEPSLRSVPSLRSEPEPSLRSASPASPASPATQRGCKRDATHLEEAGEAVEAVEAKVVIEGAAYQYFQVDPCRAVIPGMPDGGWQPGEVVPHRRITRWMSRNIVRVYALCVNVRVPDRVDEAGPGETEWRGAFEYYKTSAWEDFVAKHPEWSDIGHCYFLILGGHYVPYNLWVNRDSAPLRGPEDEEEEEDEEEDEDEDEEDEDEDEEDEEQEQEQEQEEQEEQGPEVRTDGRDRAPQCAPEQAAHNRACHEAFWAFGASGAAGASGASGASGAGMSLDECSGVYGDIRIDSRHAEFCAHYMLEHWVQRKKGELALGDDIARGYNSYKQTARKHNQAQQRLHTLDIKSKLLDPARKFLPGFAEIERSVLRQLARRLKKKQGQLKALKVRYCHFLSQSDKTAGSSVFKWHRDDEVGSEESGESDDSSGPIVYTVIVKLTADKRGSAPSQMVVAGAAFPFSYGAQAGSAGWFLSKLWHMSVMPVSADTCLKLAFFLSEQA